MSNSNYYHIPLLNDLHNCFPEILYNPQRFQTVQDLLQYIIQVANQNPYERGRDRYVQQRQSVSNQFNAGVRVSPHASRFAQAARNAQDVRLAHSPHASQASQASQATQAMEATEASIASIAPFSYLFNMINPLAEAHNRVRVSVPLSNAQDTILSSLLSQVLEPDVSLSSSRMQSFLNQNVVISPTDEQIAENTTFRIASGVEDTNCTVCLDPIEEDQQLCCLNHCQHKFHQDCIMTWFQSNVRCPTCRHDIREP
jgi:hypothetical protein